MPDQDKQREMPTVGRIVWYREPDGSEGGIVRAAVVTHDYRGNRLGLAIMPPNRNAFIPFDRTSEGPLSGQWSWPPIQKVPL